MRTLIIRVLAAVGSALLAGHASAQVLLPASSPLAPIQEALLRDDSVLARTALDDLTFTLDPAVATEMAPRIALLRAAAEPPSRRPRAMLGVARAYVDDAAADTAIVAGLAAMLIESQSCADLFEPFVERPEGDGRHRVEAPSSAEVAALLPGFADVVARRARIPTSDHLALDQARRYLLEFASQRPSSIRIPSGTPIPLPWPLAESVALQVHRIDVDTQELEPESFVAPTSAPVINRILPRDVTLDPLPGFEPGAYRVEVASPVTGARRVRALIVSDLEIVAHGTTGGATLLATLAGKPAPGVKLRFSTDPRAQAGFNRTDGGAWPAVITGVTRDDGTWVGALAPRHTLIQASYGRHLAVAAFTADAVQPATIPGHVAHVDVDRAFHDPGDVVRMRVSLWKLAGIGQEPAAGMLPDRPWGLTRAARTRVVVTAFPRQPQTLAFHGATDEHGGFDVTFTLPAGVGPGVARIRVQVPADDKPEDDADVAADVPVFSVRDSARSPLTIHARTTSTYRPGDPDPQIDVTARLSNGTSPGPLTGTLTCTLGAHRESHEFTVDDSGRTQLSLGLSGLDAAALVREGVVKLSILVRGSDQATVAWNGDIRVPSEGSARTADAVATLDLETPAPAVGEPLTVRLRGDPGTRFLVSAVRIGPIAVQSVLLDDRGEGTATFATDGRWWPRVQLAASRASGPCEGAAVATELRARRERPADAALVVDVAPPGGNLVVACDAPRRVQPGAEASIAVRVTSRNGNPRQARVALSVVDEDQALFNLRASDLAELMRPQLRPSYVHTLATAPLNRPLRVVGQLISGGSVGAVLSESDDSVVFRSVGVSAPSAPLNPFRGESGTLPSTLGTVFFAADLETDADGRVAARVTMPDRPGRMRVTAIAFDDGGAPGLGMASIDSTGAVPIAVVAPSFMRPGDQTTVVVRIGPDEAAPRTLELRATAIAAGAVTDPPLIDAHESITLTPGEVAVRRYGIQARTNAGSVEFRVLAAGADGRVAATNSARFPVGATPVGRTWRTEPVTAGQATSVAAETVPGTALILAYGEAALVRQVREELLVDGTPTADALAATMLAQLLGDPVPSGGDELTRRAAGERAARLRTFRTADGLARLQGVATDFELTPGLVHLFAVARSFGLDVDALNVLPDFRDGFPRLAGRIFSDARGNGAVAVQGEEIQEFAPWNNRVPVAQRPTIVTTTAIAAFEYDATHAFARDAVAAFVRQSTRQPPGLLAWAAAVLARAGDAEGAQLAFSRIEAGDTVADVTRPAWLESAVARAAHRLELAALVEASPPVRKRLAEAVTTALAANPESDPLSRALAIAALARTRTTPLPTELPPVTVHVEGVPSVSTVDLVAGRGARKTIDLSAQDRPFTVRATSGPVFAFIRRPWHPRPDAARTSTGLLSVVREVRRAGADSPLPASAPDRLSFRVGEMLDVQTSVTAPKDSGPLLVECPLPPGCQILTATPSGDLRDDRILIGFDDAGDDGRRTVRMRLVVTSATEASWPPDSAWAVQNPALVGAGAWMAVRAVDEGAPVAPRTTVNALSTATIGKIRDETIAALPSITDAAVLRARLDMLAGLPLADACPTLASAVRSLAPLLRTPEVLVPLVLALGANRTELLNGPVIAEILGDPPAIEALAALAAAIGQTTEGRAFGDRWKLGDPAMTPLQARLAALIAIRRSFDPGMLVRALGDRRGDDSSADARGERLDAILDLRLNDAFAGSAHAVATVDGIVTGDATGSEAVLASWLELIRLVRGRLATDRGDVRWARLGLEFGAAVVRPPFGARVDASFSTLLDEAAALHRAAADALVASLVNGDLDPGALPTEAVTTDTDAAAIQERVRVIVAWARGDPATSARAQDVTTTVLARMRGRVPIQSTLGLMLMGLASTGSAEWAMPALEAIDKRDRAALPVPVFVARLRSRETAQRALELILDRPDAVAILREALRQDVPRDVADEVVSALARIEANPFEDLPIARLVALQNLSESRLQMLEAEVRRRVEFDPETVAAALSQTREGPIVSILIRALGDAHFIAVPWSLDDPENTRTDTRLRARAGEPDAGTIVRGWLEAALTRSQNASDADVNAWWSDLSNQATPQDVQRFGRLPDGSPLTARAAQWTKEDLKHYLGSPEACPDPSAPEGPERGSVIDVVRLLPASAKKALGPELLDLWRRWSVGRTARDRVALFAVLGPVQPQAFEQLAAAATGTDSAPAPIEPRDLVAFVASLDDTVETLRAVADVAANLPSDDARVAFAQRWFDRMGRPLTVSTVAGTRIAFAPTTPQSWRRMIRGRIRSDGLRAIDTAEPSAVAALRDILRARGLLLP